ncbi:hypothetical protein GOP47_0027532 [Adiantum capillus-veneris]|nr:hypothetical protein GOP47_0027532 [Adiantum capillus-veneris]
MSSFNKETSASNHFQQGGVGLLLLPEPHKPVFEHAPNKRYSLQVLALFLLVPVDMEHELKEIRNMLSLQCITTL